MLEKGIVFHGLNVTLKDRLPISFKSHLDVIIPGGTPLNYLEKSMQFQFMTNVEATYYPQ